ncbi:UNVERIFIED_CONTAM: hypothetical protein GTU68_065673 [Idotea baltica]|nr:hypothetical protein [Idotea baltica]
MNILTYSKRVLLLKHISKPFSYKRTLCKHNFSFVSRTSICQEKSEIINNKLCLTCQKDERKNLRLLSTSAQTDGSEPRPDDQEPEQQTHFGNETVTKEEKAQRVHGVFENVAAKYDLMNDLMSGGIHRVWKDAFVARLSPTVGIKLLDVAGGTGDITFRILQHINHQKKEDHLDLSDLTRLPGFQERPDSEHEADKDVSRDESKITVCDISESMLRVGQERAASFGHANIEWVCGDAQNLPFPDQSFDAYTIAYGMRNVVDVDKALSEAYRVLKPGGRFLCLEFSQVKNTLIRSVYDLYSFQLIPVMGQVVAADWDSYQYLVESIRKFPDQETYKGMIESVGFRRVTFENLTFGVTAIHSGFKI